MDGTINLKLIKRNSGVTPFKSGRVSQQTVGLGYIIIPEDVDRDNFVKTCFRTNKVSIIDDADGNVIHGCYITKEALQNVTFPKNVGEKGMAVVWVSQMLENQPMVIGTFSSTEKVTIRDDEAIQIEKVWDKGAVSITGNAKDGVLFVRVKGQQFGTMKIEVQGDENSLLEARSSGIIKVSSNKKVEVEAFEELTAKMIDPVTENESGINVNKDTLVVEANYGEGDDKNFSKTTVTTEGFITETKVGESSYKHTVNESMEETLFQNCIVKLEENKLTIQQGEAMLEISNGKWAIINNGTGLNELLTKIVDSIATLTVSTAVGPSGTPLPPTIQKTTELESLLKNFFNK